MARASPLPVLANREAGQSETSRPSAESCEVKPFGPKNHLRIHLEDLSHPATARFISAVPITTLLQEAVDNVHQQLFKPRSHQQTAASRPPPQQPIPPRHRWEPQEVRSVTLVVRPMDGVAYTEGLSLDKAHKEIHFSLGYIEARSSMSDADFMHEMRGVVTHEMVHVFQHNAKGTCPGGLIEGVADYVRMKSGLGAKHWKKWPANQDTRGSQWDAGYERTAYFLEWVEDKCEDERPHVIGQLNHAMQTQTWGDGQLFEKVTGKKVGEWWSLYKKEWEQQADPDDGA